MQAFLARQVGVASAMAMVLLAIVFIVAVIQFRRLNTEIEY